MTDKQIIIDSKECRYWFRPNPDDYRKCSLRGKNDNCDEIKDCFVKELLGKLALKEQECEELKEAIDGLLKIQYQLADSCNKYVQTLTEIKEIVVTENNDIKVLYNRRTYQRMKQILQKIREVIDENRKWSIL